MEMKMQIPEMFALVQRGVQRLAACKNAREQPI
jgi:hypothetical protein